MHGPEVYNDDDASRAVYALDDDGLHDDASRVANNLHYDGLHDDALVAYVRLVASGNVQLSDDFHRL